MTTATNPYKRETPHGTEYSAWRMDLTQRHVCRHCLDEREATGKPFAWADEQYSFGCYAGRYCPACWSQSGFRDATDPTARFDPMDAGESMEAQP